MPSTKTTTTTTSSSKFRPAGSSTTNSQSHSHSQSKGKGKAIVKPVASSNTTKTKTVLIETNIKSSGKVQVKSKAVQEEEFLDLDWGEEDEESLRELEESAAASRVATTSKIIINSTSTTTSKSKSKIDTRPSPPNPPQLSTSEEPSIASEQIRFLQLLVSGKIALGATSRKKREKELKENGFAEREGEEVGGFEYLWGIRLGSLMLDEEFNALVPPPPPPLPKPPKTSQQPKRSQQTSTSQNSMQKEKKKKEEVVEALVIDSDDIEIVVPTKGESNEAAKASTSTSTSFPNKPLSKVKTKSRIPSPAFISDSEHAPSDLEDLDLDLEDLELPPSAQPRPLRSSPLPQRQILLISEEDEYGFHDIPTQALVGLVPSPSPMAEVGRNEEADDSVLMPPPPPTTSHKKRVRSKGKEREKKVDSPVRIVRVAARKGIILSSSQPPSASSPVRVQPDEDAWSQPIPTKKTLGRLRRGKREEVEAVEESSDDEVIRPAARSKAPPVPAPPAPAKEKRPKKKKLKMSSKEGTKSRLFDYEAVNSDASGREASSEEYSSADSSDVNFVASDDDDEGVGNDSRMQAFYRESLMTQNHPGFETELVRPGAFRMRDQRIYGGVGVGGRGSGSRRSGSGRRNSGRNEEEEDQDQWSYGSFVVDDEEEIEMEEDDESDE